MHTYQHQSNNCTCCDVYATLKYRWMYWMCLSPTDLVLGGSKRICIPYPMDGHLEIPRRGGRVPKTTICYASVNSSCAHPPPPRQLRGICAPCQFRGWGISKFGMARGSGICLPRGYPRCFDTLVVSDSKSKHGGFHRKGPAIRRRLDPPSWTGQTSGGFLDFMHFFIAYQGIT